LNVNFKEAAIPSILKRERIRCLRIATGVLGESSTAST